MKRRNSFPEQYGMHIEAHLVDEVRFEQRPGDDDTTTCLSPMRGTSSDTGLASSQILATRCKSVCSLPYRGHITTTPRTSAANPKRLGSA